MGHREKPVFCVRAVFFSTLCKTHDAAVFSMGPSIAAELAAYRAQGKKRLALVGHRLSDSEDVFGVFRMYTFALALHIIAWTSWMAGLFYLPRLFVYHVEDAMQNSDMARTFATMQLKLIRVIMNPAMIVTWITGLWLIHEIQPDFRTDIWLYCKLALVLAMSGFHGACARWRKELAAGPTVRSGRFFRIANEVPTLLFVAIVLLVIFKPTL
jgi:putative membrane protein